ncbi:hypothetical protein [Larsenimonas salina]|uniref:hypothetical protein n=1 Tax=Larsenimonas salina TaxID=1295565 RepID=UPI002072C4EC|nr:hypothetical protein [Larsenimonas salina]MCM5705555.1 hypothetical protein [Larsenimonas salina]
MNEVTSSYAVPPRPECCELCGRAVEALTKHHLIPRTVHRKKRFRKRYSKEQMHTAILWLCRPCHRHIHVVLSEQAMAEQYASRAALMTHPDIAEFVTWLSAKPPGFQPSSRRPRR